MFMNNQPIAAYVQIPDVSLRFLDALSSLTSSSGNSIKDLNMERTRNAEKIHLSFLLTKEEIPWISNGFVKGQVDSSVRPCIPIEC